jgi:ABC-type Fe3+ transport system permease subunit
VALTQLICVALAIPVLLGLSFVFGWQQYTALRRLRDSPALPVAERRQQRRQAYRRLVTCGLLALLALLLAGAQLFLEERADNLIDEQRAQSQDQGAEAPFTPEQRNFARFYGVYWIVCLVVLLAVVGLAGIDLWETRRRGLRERRKLLDDQRGMLRRQITRLRQERDERN